MPDSTKAPATEALNTNDTVPIIAQQERYNKALEHLRLLSLSDLDTFTFQIFNDVKDKAKQKRITPEFRHGSLHQHWQWLIDQQARGAGAYVAVNQTDLKGRKSHNITAIRTLTVDIDFKNLLSPEETEAFGTPEEQEQLKQEILAACPVPPHIVNWSGRGLHLYWLVTGFEVKQFKGYQERIIAYFKQYQPDPMKNPSMVLRLAGTQNLKYAPLEVFTLSYAQHERYTIDEISAAFPELPKPEKPLRAHNASVSTFTGETQDTLDGWTPDEIFSATYNWTKKAVTSTSDGNRHVPLKEALPTICSRNLSYEQMLACVYLYVEYGHKEKQAIRQLDDAIMNNPGWVPNLPARKKHRVNDRLKKLPNRLNELDLIRSEMASKIAEIMDNPTGKNYLIKMTVGVGKTRSAINDLRTRLLNPEKWPKVPDSKGIMRDAQVLFCVDTKDQAKEVQRELAFEFTDTPIYEGRNSKNCREFKLIEGSRYQNKYCVSCIHNPRSENFAGFSCHYKAKLYDIQNEKLIITPKAALLTDYNTDWGDIVIIDEDISQYFYQKEQYDEQRLRKYINLLSVQSGTGQIIDWINQLIEKMKNTPQYKNTEVDKDDIPIVSDELIDLIESFGGNEMDENSWRKADGFLSILKGNFVLDIGHNHLEITREAEGNAAIIDSKTVINLDATPRESLMKRFNFEITSFETKQNLIYYQLKTAKLTKRDLQYSQSDNLSPKDINKRKTMKALTAYISKLQRFYGEELVVFTHKMFAENLRQDTGADVGEYKVHSRGLNIYEHKQIMVMLSAYCENQGSIDSIAKVLGVDKDKLLQETNDAEMLQTIGRVRGVNAIHPKHVLILSREQLPLCSKAQDIATPENNLKTEFNTPKTQLSSHTRQNNPFNNEVMGKVGVNTVNTSVEPIKSPKPSKKAVKTCKLALFVQECIETHGFFHPELIFGGSYFAPLGSAPEISYRTYQRRIKDAVKLWGLEVSTLDVGHVKPLSVYGSPDAASQHLLKPVESVPQKFTDTAKQELFSLWWTTGRYEDSDGMPLILSSEPLPDALSDYVEPHNNIWRVHDMFLAADFSGH